MLCKPCSRWKAAGTFRLLMEGAVNDQAKIDQLTDRALVAKWPLGRIDPTLRAVKHVFPL